MQAQRILSRRARSAAEDREVNLSSETMDSPWRTRRVIILRRVTKSDLALSRKTKDEQIELLLPGGRAALGVRGAGHQLGRMRNGFSVISRATLFLIRGLRKMYNSCFGAVRDSVHFRRAPLGFAVPELSNSGCLPGIAEGGLLC